MASEIKDKFGTSTALTITIASLASSTAGVGRQSNIVDNTTARYGGVVVYYKITQGTSPTGSKAVRFALIRADDDGTPHRDFAAGASDAGLTVVPDPNWVHVAPNAASPSTGDVLQGSFYVQSPGPKWGILIVHDTVAALNSTGGNHWLRYVGINPEAQ
jgi:hypothetical protein